MTCEEQFDKDYQTYWMVAEFLLQDLQSLAPLYTECYMSQVPLERILELCEGVYEDKVGKNEVSPCGAGNRDARIVQQTV